MYTLIKEFAKNFFKHRSTNLLNRRLELVDICPGGIGRNFHITDNCQLAIPTYREAKSGRVAPV
jgi:hypothetical protein